MIAPALPARLAAVVLLVLGSAALRAAPATPTPAWIVTRVFGGVGGFAVYGLDADADLRPSEGDPYTWTNFDGVSPEKWQVRRPDAGGAILVEDRLIDFSWSRGTGYACLYYRSEGTPQLSFHLAHNGVASAAWCDGAPVALVPDAAPPKPPAAGGDAPQATTGITDQGNAIQVVLGKKEGPRRASLPGGPGWHRLLLKLTDQEAKGASLAFSASFTDAQGQAVGDLQTATSDPEGDARLHALAAPLTALAKTDAPFNLARAGRPLKVLVTLAPIAPRINKGVPVPPFAGPPKFFGAVLHARLTDYDGKEIGRYEAAATFPTTVLLDLGTAPGTGYYALHLSLSTAEGKPICTYPPDGFSVIGGTAAQAARREAKKMAVTYYFMAGEDRYKTLFFPYMHRIGILRNVGGMNGRAPEFYKEAHDEGLSMAADLWNHDDPAYAEAYVQETAPYVDTFKSFNEIDISPQQKKTAEYWVDREKREYALVKKYAPDATVLGGSLVRVGTDPWFEECLRLGLDQYQDAWDVHCYPNRPPPLEGVMANSNNESEPGVLTVYARLGKKNAKPFWMGETGARCSHDSDARRWQADMVTKMAAWALSRPDFRVIGFLVPWDYSREKGSLGDIEAGHMPAEAAYYTASALVDGFPYRRLDLGPAVQAARFGETVLLWSTQGPRAVKVPLEGDGPWVKVDVVGRVSPTDGALTVGAGPVYVLSRAAYDRLTALSPKDAP